MEKSFKTKKYTYSFNLNKELGAVEILHLDITTYYSTFDNLCNTYL